MLEGVGEGLLGDPIDTGSQSHRYLSLLTGYLDVSGYTRHGYTGKRGYHPLLAIAADVLMARLREGRANTARGAAPLPA